MNNRCYVSCVCRYLHSDSFDLHTLMREAFCLLWLVNGVLSCNRRTITSLKTDLILGCVGLGPSRSLWLWFISGKETGRYVRLQTDRVWRGALM